MSYRLGVDIGGTFTDAVMIDEATGSMTTAKVPSTPADPAPGFLNVTERILSNTGVTPESVSFIVHATTVATNAIIQGEFAATAFITTDGFRDMLEIARQIRPVLYDLQFEKPPPLVPRNLCFGIPERLDARGKILTPLDEEAVIHVAKLLEHEKIESVAVCLLHAYLNPIHERRIRDLLEEHIPEIDISLSSDISPEFREYFRASTTVINAGIKPVVDQYLGRIEHNLRNGGVSGELLVMHSNGGMLRFETAREKPVQMVESGPAAGVIAAAELGTVIHRENLVSFDMGGTTAKVGLILDGKPGLTRDYEVGEIAQGGSSTVRASGYPIRVPVIDLVEIGAGGGSIAWVDAGGALRVGPQSAGADPGPACYPNGGDLATVTDANLLLGRLNPGNFLGGEYRLHLDQAREAIRTSCADPLDLDVIQAASSIVEIANSNMINALRLMTVQRGYDPRDFSLVAFGGAGPLHADRLAGEVGITEVIVPRNPGVFSATGLLKTDIKYDFTTTLIQQIDDLDADTAINAMQKMQNQARMALEHDGFSESDIQISSHVDLRYSGQSFEITVSLLGICELADSHWKAPIGRFHKAHELAYGYSAADEPVELVNLRVTATGSIRKPAQQLLQAAAKNAPLEPGSTRAVFFVESGDFTDCPIFDRRLLRGGHRLSGPAVVEDIDSTTVIHPGHGASVDNFGNLIITVSSRSNETSQSPQG